MLAVYQFELAGAATFDIVWFLLDMVGLGTLGLVLEARMTRELQVLTFFFVCFSNCTTFFFLKIIHVFCL